MDDATIKQRESHGTVVVSIRWPTTVYKRMRAAAASDMRTIGNEVAHACEEWLKAREGRPA